LVSAGNSLTILRMKRTSVAILSALLITLAQAQEPKISARIDSSRYKVGDWILLHVTTELPQSVDSLVLAAKDSLGGFEILNVEKSAPQNNQQEWTLRLAMFDTGDVSIPPVPFSYRSRPDTSQRIAYSNPVAVSIVAIPFDPKGDIKDIKPPLDAPWKFEDFLPYLIALLIIGLVLVAYYYYRKWKKRREEGFVPAKPSIPPGQIALAALRSLEDKHLWQQGKVKQYYSEVTEIIRRFLEDQYGVLALESTSDEIISQLMKLPEAQALLKEFRSFFTTADLVKFAKYLPTPDDHENELRWGYEVVRSMIPQVAAEQPESREVENVR
jgi:hypothetical protein